MAVYGITQYGTDFYGYDIPPAFRVDPFVAASVNYSSVLVTWTQPAGTILAYRLVKNRFGFPVDQDDGEILIDSLQYPGSQFTDTEVVPGTYQYYGFFVLLNFAGDQWVRSGWTSCLAVNNYSSGLQINEFMPSFYKQAPELSPIVPQSFPASFLDFFCTVLGWGVDYLKTQYDTYLHVNDPWKITIKDLYNLAAQLGININPDIHPYTLRKAIFFNAVVNQQRGTTSGLTQELEALTGWAADLTLADNFMLENDQSAFLDPSFVPWSGNITYNVSEFVSFGNFWYQCISTGNYGHSPTGTNSSNTWWAPVVGTDNNSFIANPKTLGGLNTWELLNPNATNGTPAASSFFEVLGIANPLNTANFQYNGLDCYNKTGSTGTVWVRSISRVAANNTPFAPDKTQGISDGIPVPFVNNPLTWNGTTWNASSRFGTDQIVTYNNVPFIALRASTNVLPPYTARATVNNEWVPVSLEPRIRLCVSAYLNASSSGITATPFVEWYDNSGNFITRLIARNTTAGVMTAPTGLAYDSFTYPSGNTVGGRKTDDGGFTWTQRAGTFGISAFSDGCAYPLTATQRTYATVNSGVSNCQVGVTFLSAPAFGDVTGLILRWQDDNNYLRATMTEIDLKLAGSFTVLGTYSTAASVGDRLVVTLNGSTITAFVNNIQVLQVTSSFNTSGTIHGIVSEGSLIVTNPGTQSNTIGQGI